MRYILVLTQDGLVCYSKKNQPQLLAFPPQVVRHQEIINNKLFEEYLQNFFSHFVKQETTLFLSNELIFSGSVALSQGTVLEEEQKNFVDAIPFSSDAVETIHVKTKTEVYFFATNSDLYKTILAVAHKNACTIKHVVPLLLFGQSLSVEQLTYDILTRFMKQNDFMTHGDFLQISKSEEKKPSIVRQVIMLIFALSILGGSLLWALATIGFFPTK